MSIRTDDTGPYLPPGTAVRLDSTGEQGIVVHCWLDDETRWHDCYVAFFGDDWPSGKPAKVPYVLRYASTSLTVVERVAR